MVTASGRPAQCLLDHSLRSCTTKRPLLGNVVAYRRYFLIFHPGAQPPAIFSGPLFPRRDKRQIGRMQRNQRITGFPDMGVHAGPAILLRQRNHRGAHRIQFDISAYHQCVTIKFDQAGLEPILPQGARLTMTVVEELDIALANSTHRNRQCFRPRWRQQQMDRRERQCRFRGRLHAAVAGSDGDPRRQ